VDVDGGFIVSESGSAALVVHPSCSHAYVPHLGGPEEGDVAKVIPPQQLLLHGGAREGMGSVLQLLVGLLLLLVVAEVARVRLVVDDFEGGLELRDAVAVILCWRVVGS
jgi:hypothetical protein